MIRCTPTGCTGTCREGRDCLDALMATRRMFWLDDSIRLPLRQCSACSSGQKCPSHIACEISQAGPEPAPRRSWLSSAISEFIREWRRRMWRKARIKAIKRDPSLPF